MSDTVFLMLCAGAISYFLSDIAMVVVSIIAQKPFACMFFGLIELIGACALSYMIHGDLFPEFQSYILQSEVNFIPALWGIVILGFASAVLMMFRGAHLLFRCDIY